MNSISSVSNPIAQQSIVQATSLAKNLLGTTTSVGDSSQFAANFMNTLQKATLSPSTTAASNSVSGISAPSRASSTGKIGQTIDNLIKSVDSKQKESDAETKKVLAGKSDNLHQSMIKMQEASVAFSLMVEVRNKLIESYQELMRTSV